MRGLPKMRERIVVFGTDEIFSFQPCGTHRQVNVPAPIVPPPWCEIARHLFPTGTGARATQPVSRSLGNPSSPPVHRSVSCISNSSAYMHLLAHGLVFLSEGFVPFFFPLRLEKV